MGGEIRRRGKVGEEAPYSHYLITNSNVKFRIKKRDNEFSCEP